MSKERKKAVHELVGDPAQAKCGIEERRRWLRWRSMVITGTRGEGVTCKRCLKK
jgi:hypothetical protein